MGNDSFLNSSRTKQLHSLQEMMQPKDTELLLHLSLLFPEVLLVLIPAVMRWKIPTQISHGKPWNPNLTPSSSRQLTATLTFLAVLRGGVLAKEMGNGKSEPTDGCRCLRL